MDRRSALRALAALGAGGALVVRAQPRPAGSREPPALEREALLRSGEAALARGDADGAEGAFDRVASTGHVAKAEIGIARTHMQRGDYSRGLALSAHIAGDHPDVTAGAALYAWLLHIGGEQALAGRVLEEARRRTRDDALLVAVQAQLRSANPLATGRLLDPPARLAPYGAAPGLRPGAGVVAAGTLVDGGRRALVPIDTVVPGRASPWLRDGLGRFAATHLERRLPALQVAVLRLDRTWETAEETRAAPSDAFPGSVAHVVRYAPGAGAIPRWPLLASGFVGAPTGGDAGRELAFVPASDRGGGPVFDASGRLIGTTIAGRSGAPPHLVQMSQLAAAFGAPFLRAAAAAPRAGADRVYETGMRTALQVIA